MRIQRKRFPWEKESDRVYNRVQEPLCSQLLTGLLFDWEKHWRCTSDNPQILSLCRAIQSLNRVLLQFVDCTFNSPKEHVHHISFPPFIKHGPACIFKNTHLTLCAPSFYTPGNCVEEHETTGHCSRRY